MLSPGEQDSVRRSIYSWGGRNLLYMRPVGEIWRESCPVPARRPVRGGTSCLVQESSWPEQNHVPFSFFRYENPPEGDSHQQLENRPQRCSENKPSENPDSANRTTSSKGCFLWRLTGCAILVTFIWNRRCPSVITWARWGVPMGAFPFHWDSQFGPQIFRLSGWGCRWMSRGACPPGSLTRHKKRKRPASLPISHFSSDIGTD